MLQIGQEVTVTSSSYPGEKFRGQITLIDPSLTNVKRTGRVRLDIQNPDLKLKPDMYVDLVLDMDMKIAGRTGECDYPDGQAQHRFC